MFNVLCLDVFKETLVSKGRLVIAMPVMSGSGNDSKALEQTFSR